MWDASYKLSVYTVSSYSTLSSVHNHSSVADSESNSGHSIPSYVGWVAALGATAFLLVGCSCFITTTILLIRAKLKKRRVWQVPQNSPSPIATCRTRLPVLIGPQTSGDATGYSQSVALQDVPLLGGLEADSSNDNDADPGMDPVREETDDEQPLLPN